MSKICIVIEDPKYQDRLINSCLSLILDAGLITITNNYPHKEKDFFDVIWEVKT